MSPIEIAPEPSCVHFGQKWDPDDSGFARCYDCLTAEGWEYDAEYDEGWRDRWARAEAEDAHVG